MATIKVICISDKMTYEDKANISTLNDKLREALCPNGHGDKVNELHVNTTFTGTFKLVSADVCCQEYFSELRKNSLGLIQD